MWNIGVFIAEKLIGDGFDLIRAMSWATANIRLGVQSMQRSLLSLVPGIAIIAV